MKRSTFFLAFTILFCISLNAQWVQTSLDSVDVHCFAVSGTNLFVGTPDRGVFLSTNNGTSWTQTGLTNYSVFALVVSGTNIIAGCAQPENVEAETGGVFLSTNNGTSWTQTGLTNTPVHALAVSGANLFAGTDWGGVFLSTDNGSNWTQTGLNSTSVWALVVSLDGINLYAGGWISCSMPGAPPCPCISRSTDNGTTWTTYVDGHTHTLGMFNSLAISDTNLFAGKWGGVFLSTDNGTSWTAANTPFSDFSCMAQIESNLFAGTGDGVFLSTNNGTSWKIVNSGLTKTNVSTLVFSDTNLFAGTGYGVWRRSLSNLSNIITHTITATAGSRGNIAPSDSVYVEEGSNATFTIQPNVDYHVDSVSVDGSSVGAVPSYTFTNVTTNHTISATFAINQYTITASAGTNGTIIPSGTVTVNPGGGQVFIIRPDTGYRVDSVFIDGYYDLQKSRSHDTSYTFTNVHWYRTIRVVFGLSPITITIVLTNRWNIVSVPFIFEHPTKDYLFPFSSSDAYRYSLDFGYQVSETLKVGCGYWLKFPNDTAYIMTGIPMPVDSIDVKTGWNLIGSIDVPVIVTNIQSIPGGIIMSQFFGYDGGYYQTDTIQPGGGYWVKASQAGQLVLSSMGGVAMKSHVTILPTLEEPPPPPSDGKEKIMAQDIPTTYILEQNYPNPFNSETNIKYSIPNESFVSLKLFDLLGREIKTFVNEKKEPGEYEISWNSSDTPSGIYFYRIVAGNYIETEKMVLMK